MNPNENQKKIPIYQIIEKDLRVAILNGEFKQGDLVPSETELAAKYKVSRMTVRQAINNLLIDGYIYRHKGRGTFVTFNKMEMEKNSHFFNYNSEVHDIDGPMVTTMMNFEVSQADEIVAARLQLKIGAPIYYIERLKTNKNIVLVYERLYLPCNMYPNLTEENFPNSFYKYVEEELLWKIKNSTLAIEARALSKKVSELFHQQEGEPTLYVSSVAYLDNGRAFEYTRSYYNAEYFRFKYNSPRQ
ncbi:MAG: GntR family transcriptional regulator [Bacilli bacterium]|nr:GntR family transcriptional regulator [Bacilli bacterium]